MDILEPAAPRPAPKVRPAVWLVLTALGIVTLSWLLNSPEGLSGKADAIGYAICHRIDTRSFFVGNIQMPLCARCTGIYLGVVLGIVLMAAAGRSRAGLSSPVPLILTLVAFIAVMGVDGVNSYLTLIPRMPHLYQPQNWLRLITGMLNGLAITGLVFPIFNQTLWRNWEQRPTLANFRELGGLLVVAAVVVGIVLTGNPVALYPLALLSSLGVLILLTITTSMIFMLATRTENRARTWREAFVPLAAGLTLSLAAILFIDVMRFALTGTWNGFSFPSV